MRMKLSLTSPRFNKNPEIDSECRQIEESLSDFSSMWSSSVCEGDERFLLLDYEFDSTAEAWLLIRDTLEVFTGWSAEVSVK
jgi:hypothetical protein